MPPAEAAAPRAATDREKLLTPAFSALLLVNLAFSFALSVFFMLPKFMAQVLGADATQIGAVTAAFGVVMVFVVPLVARLLDGSRERSVLVAGCLLLGLSSLGFVWVETMGIAVVALRCVQGIALSMFVNASSVLVADLAPRERLTQAFATFAGIGMVMSALAPSLTEWIAERHSFAPAFLLASVVSGVGALLGLRVRARVRVHEQPSSLRAVLRRTSSQRAVAVLASAGLGFGVMFGFSAPFALERGIPNVRAFFVAFACAAAFVRVCLGASVDRVGPRRVATLALAGYGASLLAMVGLSPERLWLLGGLFGLSHGLFMPAFTAFLVHEGEEHERGKLMTLANGAFNFGNCLVLGLGLVADHHGYPSMFALAGALVLAAPLLLLNWPASTNLTIVERADARPSQT